MIFVACSIHQKVMLIAPEALLVIDFLDKPLEKKQTKKQ